MNAYEQKYKELHARVALFPGKKKKTVSVFHPRTLSERVAALGTPKVRIIEKPVYLGEPGKKGDQGEIGKPGRDGRHGQDGYTPIKGKDYLTHDEIEALKREIHDEVLGKIPEVEKTELPKPLEVNQELVKKIVQIMHELPESDKLEVSKGIRNSQSFIFGKTKYQVSELMHGGGSSSSSTSGYQVPTSGAVNGTNRTFVWTTAPNVIVLDNGNAMNKVSADGTVNWTGSTTTVLSQAPNYNIYATA